MYFDERIKAQAAVMKKDGRVEFNADDLEAVIEPYLSAAQKQAIDMDFWIYVQNSNGKHEIYQVFKKNGVYVSIGREDR